MKKEYVTPVIECEKIKLEEGFAISGRKVTEDAGQTNSVGFDF